ncbi:hypothetical protein FB451DRAFT_1390002 [Mycena latifolia]|nr:hypothetical protein FB451DRAFT_1390002 [Mycena latifolia]
MTCWRRIILAAQDVRDLLLIFQESEPVEFNWETHFPERGLRDALRQTRPNIHQTLKPGKPKTPGQVLFEVTLARRIMHHHSVPEAAVADRMQEMGMGAHWHALMANNLPPPRLDLVPRRDPDDTGPFMFSAAQYQR